MLPIHTYILPWIAIPVWIPTTHCNLLSIAVSILIVVVDTDNAL